MEPSLAIRWQEYRNRVSSHLGWGPGVANGGRAWTQNETFQLDGVVASGLRIFYYAATDDGGTYDWSFLKPTATLGLASGASTAALPDDFGSWDGILTVRATSTTSQPWGIEWRNEGSIREMYAVTPARSGPPMFVAEQPLKGTTATQGQRRQLLVFPLADAAYTLQGTYHINPDCLDGAFPYAYGGAQHSETILEACLSVAEERLDDLVNGPHAMKFKERLRASIGMDRRNKPQKLGYNGDRSDDRHASYGWRHLNPVATYNGASLD